MPRSVNLSGDFGGRQSSAMFKILGNRSFCAKGLHINIITRKILKLRVMQILRIDGSLVSIFNLRENASRPIRSHIETRNHAIWCIIPSPVTHCRKTSTDLSHSQSRITEVMSYSGPRVLLNNWLASEMGALPNKRYREGRKENNQQASGTFLFW